MPCSQMTGRGSCRDGSSGLANRESSMSVKIRTEEEFVVRFEVGNWDNAAALFKAASEYLEANKGVKVVRAKVTDGDMIPHQMLHLTLQRVGVS